MSGRVGRPMVRPAIRRLAIAAVIVLIPIAAHRIWDYVELRRLIVEIERIQARGEPVTRLEAEGGYRALSPDERHAASYMLAAAAIAFRSPLAPADLQSLHEWLAGSTLALPAADELAARLHTRAQEDRDVTRLADAAAPLPFRTFPPGTSYSYLAQSLAQASVAIAVRTASLSLAADGDAAVDSAVTALQFRRGLDDVFLRFGDHDTAVVLSFSEPSAAQLLRLQRALEAEDDPGRPVREALAARASYLEQLWRRYHGGDPSAPQTYLLPWRSLAESMLRPWVSRRMTRTLRIWAEVIDAVRTPWPQKIDAAEEVRRRYAREADSAAAGPMWLVTPEATQVALWYGPAIALEQLRRTIDVRTAGAGPLHGPGQLIIDRAARVAVAIERYRRDSRGVLPDTLAALVPDYLSEVPADPFTGAPLLYGVETDAYTIYSVGADGQDNGGALLTPAPAGAARPFERGPDVGVRVLVSR